MSCGDSRGGSGMMSVCCLSLVDCALFYAMIDVSKGQIV
jgi:hypothetical protein